MIALPESMVLRNFSCHIDQDNVAWLAINCPDSPINRLSRAVMQELAEVLDHFEHGPPAGLVIYSTKDAGFIAGADIDEFAGLDTPEKGLELVTRGWELFNRLARVRYPTLALIHGHCLGGGLELALACRYRLVVDQPGTSLALPEVMLGIFPGWGGMRRLPALIGAPAALDMMLSGRPQDARKAVKSALADGMVAPRLQRQAAKTQVLSGKPRRKAAGVPALLNHRLLRALVARQTARTVDQKDPYHHYPAPRAIIEIWSRHDGNPLQAPHLVDRLIRSDTARNLLRVFRLQERLKSLVKRDNATAKAAHVHVVGAGVMGGDIAAWCALKGLTVTLQDRDRELIASAQGRANTLFARRQKNPRLARAAADRLIPDLNGDGVGLADIVIEAITENPEAKRSLYADIEPRMKAGALLATNTSSLSLAALCTDLAAPQRFIGIHFFNPVARMPLVEVVHHPLTDPAALQAGCAFVGQLDKLPLPVLDSPGFLVNAVLAPYLLEAMRCVDEGIKPEAVDEAMRAFGMPMGPIELADTVGLDIVQDAGRQLAGQHTAPACLQERLARGHLGRKTDRGFYRWKDGKPIKSKATEPAPGLAERLIAPLIQQTRVQVDRGVVDDADLADAGVIFGTGFAPFTGGPLHYSKV